MATKPSEEGIGTVSTVTGLPAAEAARWLKAYNCDPQKASNAYYDNNFVLPISDDQSGWDERPFKNDISDQPSFTIHRSDTLAPDVFGDSAPSRPPSRMSANGTVTALGSRGENRPDPTLAEHEKEDISQAMSQSMNSTRGPASQETGVIDGLDPHFGPATRDHYDSKDWTVTFPGTSVQEIVQNPDAVNRKRAHNAPAFLRPSLAENRLPALITILHAIPMAREALLNKTHLLPDYGLDAEWWDGVPASMGMLAVLQPTQEYRYPRMDELIYEFQRLMAFLDETERAYGSSDALARLPCLSDWSDASNLGDVLEKWATVEASSDMPYSEIFKSEAMRVDLESEPESRPFSCLEIQVPAPADWGLSQPRTLYDVIDFALWSSVQDYTSEFAFLNKVGEVLCMQITAPNKTGSGGLGIKVPPVLFLDRYLETSKRQIQDMLQAQQSLEQDMSRIERLKARITKVKPSIGDGTYSLLTLIARAMDYYDDKEISTDGSGFAQISEIENKQRVLKDLKTLAANIDEKLQTLEESRQETLRKFADISHWYTRPSIEPGKPPSLRYTLRGVSAAKDTIYVLENTRALGSDDLLNDRAEEWQWWKLSFSQGQAQPVSQTRVREIEALKAARDESNSALLVYASEKAVALERSNLPPQLRNFVRADNLNFASELGKCEGSKPTTPIEQPVQHQNTSDPYIQFQGFSTDTENLRRINENKVPD